MAAERRPMRRSKALDETILKHPLNFPNEVTCQVKVRSNVKIGAFRLRAVETSKLSVLGQNLLRVLLKYRARHWLSECFDIELGSRSRSGHKRSPYIKHKYQRCGTCFVGYFTRRIQWWWSSCNLSPFGWALLQGQVKVMPKIPKFWNV